LGVAEERIYTDHGMNGTTRARPGLDQALAAVRAGDTLVVSKLDRLARSVPDARAIADQLSARAALSVPWDPADPMGKMFKMFLNILATFAEFEADLIHLRTREGMAMPAPRASYAANSRSSPTSSRGNCARCTAPASTRSAIWRRCSRSRGRRSVGRSLKNDPPG
jgi:DNA invertase Pin-like site-specific DNA recombinase